MNFDEYQKKARKTAVYNNAGKNYIYPTLGLVGESGEVAEIVKRVVRDPKGKIDNIKKKEIEKELGDVLWYISQLAAELGLSLDKIAQNNIKKLADRKTRGVLHGKGNNR